MKKILLIVAALAIIIPMTVGASFSFAANVSVAAAENSKDLATDGDIPTCVVSFSKNVSAYYAGLQQEYAITTAHTSGNKTYGSWSGSTLIYWEDNADGTAASSADSATIQSDWTEM